MIDKINAESGVFMQEVFLGEAIRKRRLELGLTQEQLCEGICEPITVSRLENGKQTPSRNRINALLERLDMPADRYFALLSRNELELEALQKRITICNVRFCKAPRADKAAIREAALAAHREMEAIMEADDTISRQLLLRSRVILGKEDGPYSPAEQRAILLDAIRLTHPKFDPEEINLYLYTTDEIKIINQLALTFAVEDDHLGAIAIFRQLYNYIRKHFQNIPPIRAHFPMVAFNYAQELVVSGQYRKTIEIAEEGRQICLDYGHYQSLPGLLAVTADAYHFLGEDEKSRELYMQTYYLAKAIEHRSGLEAMRADAKKYLNLEFPD